MDPEGIQRDWETRCSAECISWKQLTGCSNVSCCSHQHADVSWWNHSHLSVIWSDTDAAAYGGNVGFHSCCLRCSEEVQMNDEGTEVSRMNRQRWRVHICLMEWWMQTESRVIDSLLAVKEDVSLESILIKFWWVSWILNWSCPFVALLLPE